MRILLIGIILFVAIPVFGHGILLRRRKRKRKRKKQKIRRRKTKKLKR